MQIDLEMFQEYSKLTSPELFVDFLSKLERLFFKYSIPDKTEEYIDGIVRSMQLWFYNLPKYSKISNKVYLGKGQYEPLNEDIIRFRETLKNPNLNPYKYLMTKLSEVFKIDDYSATFDKIVETKNTLENILVKAYKSLTSDIKSTLIVNSKNIYTSLQAWYKGLPAINKHTLFEDGEDQLFSIVDVSLGDKQVIDKLSTILLGITPCEFEEDTPYILTQKFINTKKIVEMQQDSSTIFKNCYQIWHINNGEKEMINTFSISSPNQYSNLLKREIKNIMDEYGHALSCNQKRQILISLLDEVGANRPL